jgi:alpha-1,6-mannosyltransferase
MGVDSHDFSPAHRSTLARHQLLQRTGARADSKLLLYAGRLVPEKNLGLLLDMLVELRKRSAHDWRLVVVGDGVARQRLLKERHRRVPRAIAWLGHIHDRTELARIYANCDVFVHPNPREPFGIAPLEAMAAGLPVVAPKVGGVTTYANAKNAWLALPVAKEFASAIEDAISEGVRSPASN